MNGNVSMFLKSGMIALCMCLFPFGHYFGDDIYLFENGRSLLITNTPAPGFKEKIASPKQACAFTAGRSIPASLDRMISQISEQYSLSPELVKAIIQVESNYDPSAVSKKGAKGLMQLVDGTAKRFGVNDVFDPYENILGGARYLRYLIDYFGGDLALVLAAYNAGEKAVTDYGGIPPFDETINYVHQVKKLVGFSDVKNVQVNNQGEAPPYISLSSSGTISIVN